MYEAHYIYSTCVKVTERALKRIQQRIDEEVDCSATVVGPLDIPGSDTTAWIERPNDGLSSTVFRDEIKEIRRIANEELGIDDTKKDESRKVATPSSRVTTKADWLKPTRPNGVAKEF